MADLIQFVDSLDASPTVRLDLNDEVKFSVRSFSAPPPRLRRSVASNTMRDGAHVGTSTYDARTLVIDLELIESTQDAHAAEIQKLWRELDRESNWLKYQPNGLTKPVFFRTFRSDASALEDVHAQAAMRTITLEILAEPFALGLKESLGPFTVNNDPEAGSNGCYFDATGVIGDVDAPAVLVIDPSSTFKLVYLATGADRTLGQFEAGTELAGGDTSNPGGGPDADMSGTGTNNFMRTTFATDATMRGRVSTPLGFALEEGTYRLWAAVRCSDSTSEIRVKAYEIGNEVTLPQTTNRQLVDLGLYSTPSSMGAVGLSPHANDTSIPTTVNFHAERISGTGTLDWDFYLFVPANEASLVIDIPDSTNGLVVDGVTERVFPWFSSGGGDPLLGTADMSEASLQVDTAGGFLYLSPDETTRVHFLQSGSTGHVKSRTASIDVAYWPRYLFVRPSSS